MRTSHLVLAAVTVVFAGVLAWTLQPHVSPLPAVAQRTPDPNIPVAAADMPVGLDGTVRQISDLLEAGDAAQALRLCWSPANLEQMDRCNLFAKCAESIKENEKLPPTLKRLLAVGPTKTFKTPEGLYYAEFDQNTRELTSIRFVYLNSHWYVW